MRVKTERVKYAEPAAATETGMAIVTAVCASVNWRSQGRSYISACLREFLMFQPSRSHVDRPLKGHSAP